MTTVTVDLITIGRFAIDPSIKHSHVPIISHSSNYDISNSISNTIVIDTKNVNEMKNRTKLIINS